MALKSRVASIFFTVLLLEAAIQAEAITPEQLPSSTSPGVVTQQQLSGIPHEEQELKPKEAIIPTEVSGGIEAEEAKKIGFKLNKVILEGNHVYSNKQIAEIFKDSLDKEITVQKLQEIVQAITNYYRNNGYILSRAILPPQRVVAGVVQIRVIEGYVDKVVIAGTPLKTKSIVEAYGKRATKPKPLLLKNMEYYLRLANEVPGVTAKAVLQPSETEAGASTLQLVTKVRSITGFFTYNNYGTRYIGPNQSAGQIAFNSFFFSGDSSKFMYSTVPGEPGLMKFYDISYSFLMGPRGLTLVLGKNRSTTNPSFTLIPVGIAGESTTYYIRSQLAVIRDRDRNLTLDAAFNNLDSKVSSFGTLLYFDHLRTVHLGGSYSFLDRFKGSNQINLHLIKGLPLFGANHDIESTATSRFGGNANFTRFAFRGVHLQPIYGRFSASLTLAAQYSFTPLMASEQFGFGGNQMGRGYDASEIIGDKGVAGSAEIRMKLIPGWPVLKIVEPFIFYDQGVVFNLKDVTDVKSKQSAASTGFGARFVFTKNMSGDLFWGQPLTKRVESITSIGRYRNPRVFFGIVFSA